MSRRVPVVFFGSGAFGLPTLRALRDSDRHTVLAVVSQPDRPAGRGSKLTPTPISEFAAAELPGVPLLKPEKVNVAEVRDAIRAMPAEAWVVIAFGQKLGRSLLDGRFAVNLHGSLLPRWRGAAPVHSAILGGDAITGNSVITLADRMDAGLILAQTTRAIEPSQTTSELHDLLAADGPGAVLGVLDEHLAGTLVSRAQEESFVTLSPKLSKDDARVDFAQSDDVCRRRINGLSPWPGVTVEFRGQPLKLLRASPAYGSEGEPGTLIDAGAGIVACGRGAIRLLDVQPANKRAMGWRDFANGAKPAAGERFVTNAASA